MKKSEIIAAIILVRSKKQVPTGKQIMKELIGSLTGLSLHIDQWDKDVDKALAQSIIKHLAAVKGELTMRDLVVDIDLILKRIS